MSFTSMHVRRVTGNKATAQSGGSARSAGPELVETQMQLRKVSYEQIVDAIKLLGPFNLPNDGANIRKSLEQIAKHLLVDREDILACLRAKFVGLPRLISELKHGYVIEQLGAGKTIEQVALESGKNSDTLRKYNTKSELKTCFRRTVGAMDGVEALKKVCANPQATKSKKLTPEQIVESIEALGPSSLLATIRPGQPPTEALMLIAGRLREDGLIRASAVPAEKQVIIALPYGLYIEDLIRDAARK